jgi:hypothetical protein
MSILGQKIKGVRQMTKQELELFDFDQAADHHKPNIIELENGDIIVPSQGAAMNGPGVLLRATKGKLIYDI